MALFPRSVLSTAYFPPVEYFFAIANSGKVLVEQHDVYQKQSYRNRCVIYSAGGPESLTVPVVKEGMHARPIRDIRIDYSEPWLQHHVRAICSAYNSSPFFEYYADDLLPVLERRETFLFDLDMNLLSVLLDLLGMKPDLSLTEEFVHCYGEGDFRDVIQPKHKGATLLETYKNEKTYFQVFSIKSGFVPNLSVLDLLSNEGPDAGSFLRI